MTLENVEESSFVGNVEVNYINLPSWLMSIHKVVDDSCVPKKTWHLNGEDKMIYGYLLRYGSTCGWNSIYPSQINMSVTLGITSRTISRRINNLKETGLIEIIKAGRGGSQTKNNRYILKKPRLLKDVKFFDVNGDRLSNDHFKR